MRHIAGAPNAEPASVGIETEWTLETLGWRHEVVAFGSDETNAGVRLTQSVTNLGQSDVSVGVQWMIDYQSGLDDGPLLAPVVCTPFSVGDELTTEQALGAGEIADFYRMRNNDGSAVVVENYTSTAPLADFDGTASPDRVLFGAYSNLAGAAWDYTPSVDADPDVDSAVAVTFGHAAGDALVLAPGETVSRSIVIFSAVDPGGCGDFEPVDSGLFDTGPWETGRPDTAPVGGDSGGAAARAGRWGGARVCGGSASAVLLLLVAVAGGRRRSGARR